MRAKVLGLKSAVPPYEIAQPEAEQCAQGLFSQVRDISRMIKVFGNTGIDRRYSCVPIEWYLGPHGWTDRTAVHHELRGRLRVGGDSVQLFERRYTTWGSPDATGKLVANVPRADVIGVDVRKFSPMKTGILFLAPVAAFYVFLMIAYGQEY